MAKPDRITAAVLRAIGGFCDLMARIGLDRKGGPMDWGHALFMRICDWRDPNGDWMRYGEY